MKPKRRLVLAVATFALGCGETRVETWSCLASAHPAEPGLYARQENAAGRRIELRIAHGDEPEVWLDGVRLTDDPVLQYDVAIDAQGNVAWAEVFDDNERSTLVLNGAAVAVGPLIRMLRLRDGVLAWVQWEGRALDPSLCRATLASLDVACTPLELHPQAIELSDGRVFVAGTDPVRGVRRLELRSARSLALEDARVMGDGESLLPGPRLLRVAGGERGLQIFFALRELTGAQHGEPFARGNDHLGRLAWNQAYRVRALLALHRLTGVAAFAEDAGRASLEMLAQLDANGLAFSTKYSIDDATPIALAVNNAEIHHALLDARAVLPPADAERLLDAALEMMSAYESDWVGDYRATPCIAYRYDGLAMPFNQQHALGLVALRLWRATGDTAYLARAQALLDGFVAELADLQGLAAWRYAPARFHQPTAESCNAPLGVQSPPRWEDFSHARIPLEFAEEAAAALGRPNPIDANAIAVRFGASNGIFAFALDEAPSSYAFLPPLPQSQAMARWYARPVDVPFADFDRQAVTLSHALAAERSAGDLRLTLEERVWNHDRFGDAATRRTEPCTDPVSCGARVAELFCAYSQ